VILFKGTPAGFNYTYGPALTYHGPKTIDVLYRLGVPVVLVADMIPMEELRKIELTRIRGFVFTQGNAVDDEDLYNFLITEKRAAVLSCKDAMDYICDGDFVIVDGVDGHVCLSPNEETLAAFQAQRAKGPPDEKGAQIRRFAAAMIEGMQKQREEAEALGQKAPGTPVTKEEALAMHKQAPGFVYQILAGLPLPNSPTAGHSHDHPDIPQIPGGDDHAGHGHDDHDHDHDHDPDKPMDARARRDAQKAEREARRGGGAKDGA